MFLEFEGYETKKASNGNEALRILKKDKCDLVVTDLDMPAMSGDILSVIIKFEYPDLPIIMVTSNEPIEPKVDVLLKKPLYPLTQLTDAVKLLLRE